MNSRPSISKSASYCSTPNLLFWGFVLLLLFWNLGSRELWNSEDRWLEVTREMFLGKDFFHPTINGIPHLGKPLLGYWLIALVSTITGRLDEWALRLPSAISGLLGLWATVNLGRRLWSEEVARIAGWLFLTTYGFLLWARTGTAEMENLAAITLAVAWYWANRERPKFFSYLIFYLIAFLGAQTKGLTALVVPVLIVAPDIFRKGRLRTFLTFEHFLALAVSSLIYFAPFIYTAITVRGGYQASGLNMVFRENIQRYFQPFDHQEPFYVYLYYPLVLLLPWTPLFLSAVFWVATSFKKLDQKTSYLIKVIALIFLFFALSGSRRGYYILPILPFCVLLTSVFLKSEIKERLQNLGLSLQEKILAILALIEILSLAIWPILVKEGIGFVPPGNLRLLTPLLGFLSLVPLALKRLGQGFMVKLTGEGLKLAPIIISATLLMGGLFCLQQNSLDAYRTERSFAMELKASVTGLPSREIAFYRDVSPKVLFYLNLPQPIQILRDPESVRKFLESGRDTKILVSQRKYLSRLIPVLPSGYKERPTLMEKVYPWERKDSHKWVVWKIKG